MFKERIVFFGTSEFSCGILETLVNESYNVVAAVSQPDRPSGRHHVLKPTPVHAFCDAHGICCLQPQSLRKEFQQVLDTKPDLILTCSYGQMVPEAVLKAPRLGCLNIHPSLLPKYRGGAPMHFPIFNGDTETGVSLMEMVKAMDAGRVYAQVRVPIGPDETEAQLEKKLLETSIQMVKDDLPAYLEGKLPGTPQDDSKATYCSNIPPEMEEVHFRSEPIDALYNHIRALIDWPIPYGRIEGRRVRIFAAGKEKKEVSAEPGTVLGFADHAMLVAANGGIIHIYELQMEGRKRMSADAFANGYARELTGKRFDA